MNTNGKKTQIEETSESLRSRIPEPDLHGPKAEQADEHEPVSSPKFATRADVRTREGMSSGKLALVGGGLLVAILFFVLTAVVKKTPKHEVAAKHPVQQSSTKTSQQSKGSITPLMDTERPPSPDNASGQLGPGDIRRTGSLNDQAISKPSPGKPANAGTLANVPAFADTQQKWEEPAPYGTNATQPASQTDQNKLNEPSLVFVRNVAASQTTIIPKALSPVNEGLPTLEVAPGTRIQAKLESQMSSAVLAPVVAVVEYTYAIGDRIIIPAGARIYGQLQGADRNGFVNVRFDEIELLDGAREKIEAVGTDLDLGPIRGNVYGKNNGKNFLVRAASGLGSVLAEVAGNNTSGAFSESDMLRERLAENIGTAGDSEVMSLNANSRVVVSVPADTKIYVVFTKHPRTLRDLHDTATGTQ
jgi:type IV secretory pathway VirB10-like protein